jgi:hypothetical protein
LAAPATPPAKPKPAVVTPVQAEPASIDVSSSGSSTNDPLDFLRGSEVKKVKPASATRGVPGKSKSFADTMATAVGNLFGSQSASKNAQPGITATQIGAKLKGLPPAKQALLGCGGLLAMLVLCSGLLTIGNPKGNVQTAAVVQGSAQDAKKDTQKKDKPSVQTGTISHAEGKLKSFEEVPLPIKEALAKGRKVWCLLDFKHFRDPETKRAIYAVFDGDALGLIVEKIEVKDFSSSKTVYGWSLWYANRTTEWLSKGETQTMRLTTTWTGRTDNGGIRLTCENGNDQNVKSGKMLLIIKTTTEVDATAQGWNATIEEARDQIHAIDDERTARQMREGNATFSPDGKKATFHSSEKKRFSGPVFQPR